MICDHRSLDDLCTSTYTMSQKLYVRCALSVLQNECRKVWGARYTLGARYRSENRYLSNRVIHLKLLFSLLSDESARGLQICE